MEEQTKVHQKIYWESRKDESVAQGTSSFFFFFFKEDPKEKQIVHANLTEGKTSVGQIT